MNSDESDYENGSQYTNGSVGTKDSGYSSLIPSSLDSDVNDDYYQENYQYLPFERNSPDESCSQSMQDHIYTSNLLDCNKEEPKNKLKRKMQDESSRQNKRQKTVKSKAKPNEEQVQTDLDKGKRMMKMMGYKEGCGLGKHKQGRLEPVQAPKQHGRRGFGHHIPGLEASGLKWNATEEEIKCVEDMEWIRNPNPNMPALDKMKLWLVTGPKKLTIDDETYFCHEDIVTNVISAKTVFDRLDNVEMRRARTRCNPYETIRGVIFLNRAAVKMANIDRACNFMFTKPEGLGENELLYFADVCAGPGGFSEYVLWRKKWHAKGFGFTLKNENDFKLSDFYAGPCETFHPFYGPKENGDVFDPVNQEAFEKIIMQHTHGKGVHFMMSDGGFSVEGQENIQEILSKQLYLCQCLVALMIVREKGHFVTKLFDLFTPFSAGLVYLMYRCFEEVCIFKPNSSRPANSERYLICKSKRPGTHDVMQYLKDINHLLLKGDANNDVLQLVSFNELEKEKQFIQYLRASNEELGKKQIISLCKIAAFCEDSTLVEVKQADMRKECLEYWQLPDETRTIPRHMKPKDVLNTLVNDTSFLNINPTQLQISNIKETLSCPYDWFCMPCGTPKLDEEKSNATFYMGMGRGNVYRYVRNSWQHIDDIKIELPPNTLVYAEVVYEMVKEFKYQQKVLALHIIDAFYLGGEDVSKKYLCDRYESTKIFCEALWKPPGNNYARVRAMELFSVGSDICEKLKITQRRMKNNKTASVYELPKTPLDDNDKLYFIPRSIMFLRSTAQPWNRHVSKKTSLTYVFNYKTKKTLFDNERPSEAEASFIESFKSRLMWHWPYNENLSMNEFAKFIKDKCPKY
ncbi:hypothetical protein QLX08_003305 [Tetragonisca angustula]|uniref:Cap-specific mRNA (nucleoside-2'-O-)-methyltransferase 1 n=1 Tax=Tetragonisca angustula TaxID=166442 RepID=A0AAW1A7B6_9HYME